MEQDIKFGVTPVAPKESMAASARYLQGVIEALEPAAGSRELAANKHE